MPFLYATDEADTLLYGFFINNDSGTKNYIMTVFQRGDDLGNIALKGLIHYLTHSKSFANMGFELIRTIPTDDPLHNLAHPCQRTEPKAHRAFSLFKGQEDVQHGHYLFNQAVTPELLNLFLKLSLDLEVDPNRQIFLQVVAEAHKEAPANMLTHPIKALVDYLMPAPQLDKQRHYDPKQPLPIPYLKKDDRNTLTHVFNTYMQDPEPQNNPYWTQENTVACREGYNPTLSTGQQVVTAQFHKGMNYNAQKDALADVGTYAAMSVAATCFCCYGLYKLLTDTKKPQARAPQAGVAVKKMQ